MRMSKRYVWHAFNGGGTDDELGPRHSCLRRQCNSGRGALGCMRDIVRGRMNGRVCIPRGRQPTAQWFHSFAAGRRMPTP